MAWDKEVEAAKIIKKEKEVHQLVVNHKDGRPPTPYKKTGYLKEDQMAADFYQWARNSYPEEIGLMLFHVANENAQGGELGAIRGGQRLAMGVQAGVPDYIYVLDRHRVFYLELKLPGETLNDKQKILHEKWTEKRGIQIWVINSFDGWRKAIEYIVTTVQNSTF